jgi:hypothetical protein
MKRAAILTVAVAAYCCTGSADASLRGPSSSSSEVAYYGIEEVGDQIEHFPEEEAEEITVNRHQARILSDETATAAAVANVIVRSLNSEEEEQDESYYADIDILGNVVEDPILDTGLYYWDEDDIPITKEYAPDPNSILVR